jgi:4-hydroxy-tetrahydrodipicolinate synthase
MKNWSDVRTITALKTPYLRDGSIDGKTFRRFLRYQAESGIDGIVIAGTTGEGHLLHDDEIIGLIEIAVQECKELELLVIGNTGNLNTHEAVSLTRAGFDAGMHASLQINPYYGRTSRAGRLAHFQAVLDCGPAILYNVPQRTNSDITADEILELSTHSNFIGVKECAGTDRVSIHVVRGLRCWSGNDDQAYISRHKLGCTGIISVAGNLVPKLMSELMIHDVPALDANLQPLFQWLSCEPNPIPISTALALSGLTEPVFKLPYVPMSQEQQRQGIEVLESLASTNHFVSTVSSHPMAFVVF